MGFITSNISDVFPQPAPASVTAMSPQGFFTSNVGDVEICETPCWRVRRQHGARDYATFAILGEDEQLPSPGDGGVG